MSWDGRDTGHIQTGEGRSADNTTATTPISVLYNEGLGVRKMKDER